ncbi:MAG TPA: cyclopropane-fatty-acyl-phospholipid synthase family protein [Gammaproteobacteria bacterium]|nr:cyclopropane-fatty-acyl-phospholipid synthase family protein [Gammaproteobacteria bacterium]
MNKNRLEPLGVPHSDYDFGDEIELKARRSEPGRIDRWLVGQLRSRLGESKVAIALWDEPDDKRAEATVRFNDRGALWQTLMNPGLHFGDLYSAGRISVHGDLLAVLAEAYRYIRELESNGRPHAGARLVTPSLSDSKRNIHHHYDLGNDFYKLWLDRDWMQYTCAYYPESEMTIEAAQAAKLHHVARKLRLKPGERVVEAGSGWGGLALFMAKHYGVEVKSFNISKEQVKYARESAERESLTHLVEFVEDDFRNITGTYDAFVSIGMLEHVGPGNYKEMGKLMGRVLTREGRGLVHSIGRDRPGRLNKWIDRRIFPGAHPPTLREMMDLFEESRLSVLDVENIRLHYAETLRGWLARYEDNVETVRKMFDEPFVRAWRLYLAGSIIAFVHGTLQLFQVVYARSGMNELPPSRKHIYVDGES